MGMHPGSVLPPFFAVVVDVFIELARGVVLSDFVWK